MYPPFGQTHQPDRKALPGTVLTAGIMMLIVAGFSFILTTVQLFASARESPLWLILMTYILAFVVVIAPMLMLMRKPWGYSLTVSLLLALIIGLLLDGIGIVGDLAAIQIEVLPVMLIVVAVLVSIVGTPLLLLFTKSARRAFEDDRDPNAVVWSGGGYQHAWEIPFALHPSELPPMAIVPVGWAPIASPGVAHAPYHGGMHFSAGGFQPPYY